MPESQAPQQHQAETPRQATSQPPAPSQRQVEPPRDVSGGKKAKPKARQEANPQAEQRAEQVQKRIAVEQKNPFSRDNKAQRMQELLAQMRTERGVAEPQKADRDEQVRASAGDSDVPSRASEPDSQRGDGAASQSRGVDKPSSNAEDATPEWYRREQAAQASEQKAKAAHAEAERQQKALNKAKADADAALARMAAAKDDPVQFLAETGMEPDEWKAFLLNGGKLTPEQKQLKAMAEQMAEMKKEVAAARADAAQKESAARRASEDAQFANALNDMTYVPQMGGMAAVRARQSLLSEKTGQSVSLKDAADHLESEMKAGLSRLLQNPKIRSSLNLDVNTSDARPAAKESRTLNNGVSAQSSAEDARPHPTDWAAKKRLYLQRIEQEKAARTGR